MQSEEMGEIMGMELTAQWAYGDACPAKTKKVFLCALCGLWCKSK